MSRTEKSAKDFIGYEYKEVTVNTEQASMYLDCYENFGWHADENMPLSNGLNQTKIKLKRDRKIINKTELTRLQRNFESCVSEIEKLEKSKTSTAVIYALAIGILGTAFIAGSTFAITAQPPHIVLCIILAVPGFICWIIPYFVYKRTVNSRTKRLTPMIEDKYEEIYEICKKGNKLLN